MPIHINRQGFREMLDVAVEKVTPKRLVSYLSIGAPLAVVYPIAKVTQRLDDLFYPRWREQSRARPVFIYANPRSGTTFLHRLMSLDDERFATLKIYQQMFPSVLSQRAFQALGRVDPYLGGPGRKLLDFVNAQVFKTWQDGIHEMGFDQPEEDEGSWAICFHSVTFILLCPFLSRIPSLVWFDKLPAAVRHRFMDYYEETMQRLLYAEGGDKQFLNKNVHFAPRVHSVYERFDDGIFIYMIRHPYEALPSFLSMWHEKWKQHSPEIGVDHPESIALAQMAVDYLRYGLDCRDVIPHDQFVVVKYDDLIDHPQATVEEIYAQVGMEVSSDFREHLIEATSKQRSHESTHEYSLEQFGLTKEWVYEQLKDVFEEFGFDPELPESVTGPVSPGSSTQQAA